MAEIVDTGSSTPTRKDADAFLKKAILERGSMNPVSVFFSSPLDDDNKSLSFSTNTDINTYIDQLGVASASLSLSNIVQERGLGPLVNEAHANTAIQTALQSLIKSINDGAVLKSSLPPAWHHEVQELDPSKSFWSAGWTKAIGHFKKSDMTANDWINTDIGSWLREKSARYNFIIQSRLEQPRLAEFAAVTSISQQPTHFVPFGPPDANRPVPMGCFAPGTQVTTQTGTIAIEDLKEGTPILTRAEPSQWGVRSSEIVQNPSPTHLYGINNQPAFFTAGHPFFTTTGLRAIDPSLARRENPWLEVAELKVGHHLLQTTDGKSYQQIEVTSIHAEQSHHKYVYGVHLREGLRSYHANGYLVALNYPEITIASIVDRLLTLPAHEQSRMIDGIKLIRPLLSQFGGPDMPELIEEQALGKSKKRRADVDF